MTMQAASYFHLKSSRLAHVDGKSRACISSMLKTFMCWIVYHSQRVYDVERTWQFQSISLQTDENSLIAFNVGHNRYKQLRTNVNLTYIHRKSTTYINIMSACSETSLCYSLEQVTERPDGCYSATAYENRYMHSVWYNMHSQVIALL